MTDRTILYVASHAPYPLNTGTAIRQFHILTAYAQVGNVRLVFFYREEAELAQIAALKPYCISVHPIPTRTKYAESIFPRFAVGRRRFEEIATSRPLIAKLHRSARMQALIETLAPSADLIHVCRLHMVPHVEPLLNGRSGRRFVLDLDDVETVARARALTLDAGNSWPSVMFGYYDLARLWLYQRRTLTAFDRVFVCSKRDWERFGSGRFVVIPNGANLPATTLPDVTDGKTILYCGSLAWGPNIDGLFFFLRQIFPLVQQEVPGVRLLVVGRSPTAEIRALHDGTTIAVEADVASVEPHYRRSTLLVVPLRSGSGTRLKILEALALGTPVVSTTVGCEGLDVVDGEHLAIADDPRQFARRCVDLLKAPDLRAGFIAKGRALVAARYTWDSIRTRVAETARELLSRAS